MTSIADKTDDLKSLSDVQLVRRVAAGDGDALGALYDRFAGMLTGMATRILGKLSDAEDVLQEVFVQVWNRADRYDPKRSSVSTWLVLITRSRAIDRLRSRRVVNRTLDAVQQGTNSAGHTSPEGVTDVLTQQRRQRIQQELANLPAEQKQVLEMAFYQGMTQSEIAAATGTPLGTVKTRSLLAMKKLRKALQGELEELL